MISNEIRAVPLQGSSFAFITAALYACSRQARRSRHGDKCVESAIWSDGISSCSIARERPTRLRHNAMNYTSEWQIPSYSMERRPRINSTKQQATTVQSASTDWTPKSRGSSPERNQRNAVYKAVVVVVVVVVTFFNKTLTTAKQQFGN